MTAIDFVYLVHPHREAAPGRTGSAAPRPGLALEGLCRFLPTLRLGLLEPVGGGSRGLVVSVPLSSRQLAEAQSKVARRRILSAVRAAAGLGARAVALGGLLAGPQWASFAAAQTDLTAVTGEAMEVWASLDGLLSALAARRDGTRLAVVVGPARRLTAETIAVLAARRVDGLVLLGPRPEVLAGIASRVLADSGLVAEVTAGGRGLRPVDGAVLLGGSPAGLDGLLAERAVVVDLTTAGDGWRALKEGRPDLRMAAGVSVGLPWPGPPPRLRFPVVDGAQVIRAVPPAVAEAWLETGGRGDPGQSPAGRRGLAVVRPTRRSPMVAAASLRRVEGLAALASRNGPCFGRLRWLEVTFGGKPGSFGRKVAGGGRNVQAHGEI